ncbi:MAG: ABC transporter permease [Bryobacteraceae bacterium]|nr:ABC transporter permease [Bryobacteraceae bacterium]
MGRPAKPEPFMGDDEYDMLSRDLTFALRSLRHNPGFAMTAIATIGLGIGASTAIFSVANAVLLRPLPYADPERLVLAGADLVRRNVKDFPISNADYLDMRSGSRQSFEDLAALSTGRALVTGRDGTPEQVRFAAASHNIFNVLGLRIAAGRGFSENDGIAPPPAPANPGQAGGQPQLPVFAVLSQEYFQRRFAGDARIIGQPLPVAGGPAAVVVGVLAAGAELLFPPHSGIERTPDVWVAARIPYDTVNRNNVQWRVVGRLRAGVTLAHAQSEMDGVSERLRQAEPISRTAGLTIRLTPMKEHLVNGVRPAIVALFGAVLFLLLIACANVANLLLVRSAQREREFAVRTAIGGSWWRLVRQLVTEAVIIAAFGTALGVALAWAGLREVLRLAPPSLPRLDTVSLDFTVLLFASAAGLAAAVLFGLVPAWRAARPDVNSILRGAGRNASLGGSGWLRSGVVVLEVALSFVLLIGSGLMFRTFLAVQQVDLGFDPRGLLTFQIIGNPGETPEARAAALQQVENRLAAIPGVQAVGAALVLPLAAPPQPVRWGTGEALTDETKFRAADLQIVRPGYIEAMRVPLLSGRTFSEADNQPERKVVIIDDHLAARAFGAEPAVGKRILLRVNTPKAEWSEVIGVVKHQRQTSLSEAGREQLFIADGYVGHGAAGWWAVRTAGAPAAYAGRVREAVAAPATPFVLDDLEPMDAIVEKAQSGARFSLVLIAVFAGTAALLAAVGLYGVLSTMVRQRTGEIGVRMALGAQPAAVFRLVVGHGARLSLLGIAIGIAAALALTRLMQAMLVGVTPADPLTFTVIAVLFFAVSLAAAWAPARRAAGLDPTQALRDS